MPRAQLLSLFLVSSVCLLCYLNGVGDRLIFDSLTALASNPVYSETDASFSGWLSAVLSSDSGLLSRPISMLSFKANAIFFGESTVIAYKITNIFIHILCGVFVFLLFGKLLWHLTRNSRLSEHAFLSYLPLFATAIWLLHPLNVSTVLYTVQRMTQLSALFCLIGLYGFVHYRLRMLGSADWCSSLGAMLAVVVPSTVLALLSKENGLLLIGYLVLLETLVFRFEVKGLVSRRLRLIANYAFLALIALGFFYIGIRWEWLVGLYQERDFDVYERLMTQARVLWHYVYWIVLPDISAMGFHHDDIEVSRSLLAPWTTSVALALWCLVIAGAIWLRRRFVMLSLAVAWFFVGHSMESSILPLEMVYEHRNYLPMVGICFFIAHGILIIAAKLQTKVALTVPVTTCVGLALLLAIRGSYWKDEYELSAYHLENHPQSLRSVYHFANTNLRLGEAASDEDLKKRLLINARMHYELMQQMDQSDFAALVTLIYIDSRHFSSLNVDEWFDKLSDAAQYRVFAASDLNALGLLTRCMIQGYCNISRAGYLQLMDRIIAKGRNLSNLHFYLSQYYRSVDDVPLALEHAKKAIEISPQRFEPYYYLAALYVDNGERGKALGLLGEVLRRDKSGSQLYRIKNAL